MKNGEIETVIDKFMQQHKVNFKPDLFSRYEAHQKIHAEYMLEHSELKNANLSYQPTHFERIK